MAAIFRDFTPAELTQLRHLCLRLAENQHRAFQHLSPARRRGPRTNPEPGLGGQAGGMFKASSTRLKT